MKLIGVIAVGVSLSGVVEAKVAEPLTPKEATQCFELSKVYSVFLKEAESSSTEQEYVSILTGLKLEDPKLLGLAGLAWEYRKRDNQKETRRFFQACLSTPPKPDEPIV